MMVDPKKPVVSKLGSTLELDEMESSDTTKVSIDDNCTCYVHYSVFLYEKGSKSSLRFSTNETEEDGDEQLALPVYIGQPNPRHVAHKALDQCVRLMTNAGEKASFKVPSELGYGKAGNTSFPSIPPNCELQVDAELLHVEGSKDKPDTMRTDLTFEKRMERCENLKTKGNEKVRVGSKRAALRLYESGLSYITEDLMQQLMLPKHVDLAEGLRATLRLNMSTCYLGLKEYQSCIKYCDLSRGEGIWGDAKKRCCRFRTKSDSCWLTKAQQVKAMFRKAQALENMPSEKYEEAIDVIREVRESLNAELERLSKSGERGESGGFAVYFDDADPQQREDGKIFEMFRSDYVYSGQKAARLLKLIGKREKISMAEFRGVLEQMSNPG